MNGETTESSHSREMLVVEARSEVPAELIKLVKCEEVSVHKAA